VVAGQADVQINLASRKYWHWNPGHSISRALLRVSLVKPLRCWKFSRVRHMQYEAWKYENGQIPYFGRRQLPSTGSPQFHVNAQEIPLSRVAERTGNTHWKPSGSNVLSLGIGYEFCIAACCRVKGGYWRSLQHLPPDLRLCTTEKNPFGK
jgi:hypothetical protein